MMHAFECPHCWAPIPPEACDPTTLVAECPACGTRSDVGEAMVEEPVGAVDPANLPSRVRIVRDPSVDRRVTCRHVAGWAWFLLPFAVIFAGVVWLALFQPLLTGSAGPPFPFVLLFGGFLLAMVVSLVRGFFTHTEVALHQGQGSVFVGVITFGRTRRFTYGPDTEVVLTWVGTRSGDQSGGSRTRQITLRSAGGAFSFGEEWMTPPVRRAVAAIVQDAIRGGR